MTPFPVTAGLPAEPGREERNPKNRSLRHHARRTRFRGRESGLFSGRNPGEITMKNQNPEITAGPGSSLACNGRVSPIDLVDEIQRRAFRQRFERAPVQNYPSLETVRRIVTESN